MSASALDHFMIAFCVAAIGAGQLVFKYVGQRIQSFSDIFSNYTLLALLAGALGLYAASTLVWVLVLRHVPLSYAYVFMACGFIIVPVASHFLFSEQLTPRYFLGAIMVAGGCWLAATQGGH